jgi:hypothetical protein
MRQKPTRHAIFVEKRLHQNKQGIIIKSIPVLWCVSSFIFSPLSHCYNNTNAIVFFLHQERNQIVPLHLQQVPINTTINDQSKGHEPSKTKLTPIELQNLLDLFNKWLASDDAALSGKRVARLTPASVTSYTSNTRRFLIWLQVFLSCYSFCYSLSFIYLLVPSCIPQEAAQPTQTPQHYNY